MTPAVARTPRIVIAGGGVAALEAALALRALVEEQIAIELVAPQPHFSYRPLSVLEPFALGEVRRFELSALAAEAGAGFTPGRLQGIDAARHRISTSVGDIPYDVLLVAVGVVPVPAVPGALTFRGGTDSDGIRGLLEELTNGAVRRVAFAVPSGSAWSLPLYELALLTALHLGAHRVQGVELALVTPEDEPLQIFGRAGSEAGRELLEERGIELITGASPRVAVAGELRLESGGVVPADRVVALPRLRGERLDGLPQTFEGFVPVDLHGRVRGLADVYAAGDITTFPAKQGGIAAQMADAAAEMIAAQVGTDLRPEPFRPVLRGLLLTGARPRYLRRDLTDESGYAAVASTEPLWWPPAKIVGRHLAPFLAGLPDVETPVAARPATMLPVEVDLEPGRDERPAMPRPERPDVHGDTVAEMMAPKLLVAAPEQTLAEVAARMRTLDVGSAAVTDGDRLIGILTARDLLRAVAARADPGEARVREWMTAEPVAVPASAPLERAMGLMRQHGIHHLPVVEGDRPVGMLGFRQAARPGRARGVGLGF